MQNELNSCNTIVQCGFPAVFALKTFDARAARPFDAAGRAARTAIPGIDVGRYPTLVGNAGHVRKNTGTLPCNAGRDLGRDGHDES
jgi:hypothetical protein